MKIILDNHEYSVNLSKPIEFCRVLYLKINSEGIVLKSGETIKLGDRSILRTSFKTIATPVLIPMLRKIYQEQGIILDPPVKHSDLIDYFVNAFFDLLSIMEKRTNVILASETIDNSRSSIKSIIAVREEPLKIEPPASTSNTEDI